MENNGQVSAWLNLKLAELASEVANSPYSDVELSALKCVEAIAERDEFKFSFKFKPGELFVLNNFSLMHKRSAFTDDPDHKNKRLMLRLWFNPHGASMPIPDVAKLRIGFKHATPVIVS